MKTEKLSHIEYLQTSGLNYTEIRNHVTKIEKERVKALSYAELCEESNYRYWYTPQQKQELLDKLGSYGQDHLDLIIFRELEKEKASRNKNIKLQKGTPYTYTGIIEHLSQVLEAHYGNKIVKDATLAALKVFADSVKEFSPKITEELYDYYIEPYQYPVNSKPLTELAIPVGFDTILPLLSNKAKWLYQKRYHNTAFEFIVDPKKPKEWTTSAIYNELGKKTFKDFNPENTHRFASYSQYISIRIKHTQENPDLSIYIDKIAKLFSKLVDQEFLDYGMLAPISLLRGASFNLDASYYRIEPELMDSFLFTREGVEGTFSVLPNAASLTENFGLHAQGKDKLRVLDTDRVINSTFIFMFVFPKLTSVIEREEDRETKEGTKYKAIVYDTNELHDHRVLNQNLGFDLFSEEGGFVDSFILEEETSTDSVWYKIDKYLDNGTN